MKKYFILFILFTCYLNILSAQEKDNNYVLVLTVNIKMETPARISCDNFASAFNGRLNVNTISESDSIVMFSKFVNKVKYAKHNRDLNVRGKFLYEIDATNTIIVCTDGIDILVNGRLTRKNKKFIDFLNYVAHIYP